MIKQTIKIFFLSSMFFASTNYANAESSNDRLNRMYSQCIKNEDPAVCGELSDHFLNKGYSESDVKKGCIFSEKACNLGNLKYCANAAASFKYCHELTDDNMTLYFEYLKTGCTMRNAEACYTFGKEYHQSDVLAILESFEKGCLIDPREEAKRNCKELNSLFADGFGLHDPDHSVQDNVKTIYRKACAKKNRYACKSLQAKKRKETDYDLF